jgi:hypothetical protein
VWSPRGPCGSASGHVKVLVDTFRPLILPDGAPPTLKLESDTKATLGNLSRAMVIVPVTWRVAQAQPFTAPDVRPRTRNGSNAMNRIISGMLDTIEIAIRPDQSMLYSPTKDEIPTVIGHRS